MKLAIITDTHWGARGDSREFLEYFIQFYKEVFWPEIKSRGITKVFHLGDIVDRRKYVNFVTLNALREHFIEEAAKHGVELHILVGNHDIPYRNTNMINAIGEAFSRCEHVHVYAEPELICLDGTDILLMPWINNTIYPRCLEIIKNTPAQIMFGHLEIKGFEMYRGMPSHEGYEPALFDKFDVVASGHFHKKSTSGNIYYLGSPYEMTWSDYDCPRGFHIFDTTTRTFEYIRNPLKMFHKVWYNDKNKTWEDLDRDFSYLGKSYVKVIIQEKTNPYWFDLWLDRIYKSGPIEVTIVDDHRNMDMLSDEDIINNAEDTPTILTNYVNAMETRVNKNDLDKLLREIYTEAQNLEVDDASQA